MVPDENELLRPPRERGDNVGLQDLCVSGSWCLNVSGSWCLNTRGERSTTDLRGLLHHDDPGLECLDQGLELCHRRRREPDDAGPTQRLDLRFVSCYGGSRVLE